jgi:hypothetical protein
LQQRHQSKAAREPSAARPSFFFEEAVGAEEARQLAGFLTGPSQALYCCSQVIGRQARIRSVVRMDALIDTDMAIRIENSKTELTNLALNLHRPDTDRGQTLGICEREIATLDALTNLDMGQEMSVILLLHRWKDLRSECR